MQQIAEGLKESAQNNKKRNKSQELGGGLDVDDNYIAETNFMINSSQGSLEVLAEDLSDVEQRVEEFDEQIEDSSYLFKLPKELKMKKLIQNQSEHVAQITPVNIQA